MVIVGLTGGIATGKSTVSEIFRSHGLHVVDADLIARKVVEPGSGAYAKLRSEFGDEFFDASGAMDRVKMGNLVFNDAEKRRRLNSILHPAIRWEMFMQTLKYLLFGTHYIVLDTPLLFESGYHKFLGTVIVVWCDEETEFKRLMLRDGLSKDEAVSRVAAQFPIRRKMEMATVLIDNNGTREDLRAKVDALVRELESRWAPLLIRATVYSVLVSCCFLFVKSSFLLLQYFKFS